MQISKECNRKSGVEYEMFNKQWVINKIFSEKVKEGHQLFLRGGKWNFLEYSVPKKFSAPNVWIDRIVRTGTYFVTERALELMHY